MASHEPSSIGPTSEEPDPQAIGESAETGSLAGDSDTGDQSDPSDGSVARSPWLWMVAAVALIILMPVVLEFAVPAIQVELPAEYEELVTPEGERLPGAAIMEAENVQANLTNFIVLSGSIVTFVFGVFSICFSGHPAIKKVVLGALGIAVGILVIRMGAGLTADTILRLQADGFGSREGGDTQAIMLHSIHWLLFVSGAAVAVLFASGNVGLTLKFFVASSIAVIIGCLCYAIGVSMADPMIKACQSVPQAGTSRCLWSTIPGLITGLFLSRTTPVPN